MENNGKGIFYGVIGVATLIVAIIGATFAFFSASATVEGNNTLTGATNENIGGALSASVTRLDVRDTATAGPGLVPATNDLGTASEITKAATAKCVVAGYTGCHLYKIYAKTTLAVQSATLKLDEIKLTDVKNSADWKYVLYQGTSETAPGATINKKSFNGTGDVLFDGAMTAGQEETWYLLVYIENKDVAQNDETNDETNVLGSYSGSVSFAAAGGGKVSATFVSA